MYANFFLKLFKLHLLLLSPLFLINIYFVDLAFAAAFEVIYNVQDLEQTRIRLKRAIRNEKLDELDDAITDTYRLMSKIPITYPERQIANKLRTRLQLEEKNKIIQAKKEEEEKRKQELLQQQEQNAGPSTPQQLPSSLQTESLPSLSHLRSKKTYSMRSFTKGEVDIESQRLFKETFIRALLQLGQDVLFRTGTLKN